MALPRPRYTIRGMMIATAAIAGILAIPGELRVFAVFLSIPLLAPFGAWWFVWHDDRRLAAYCFWTPAVFANISVAGSMLAPDGWFAIKVFVISFFVLLPTLLAFGFAWAFLANRGKARRMHTRILICLSVVVASLGPAATTLSTWPLRVGFLFARPSLHRLAVGVASGQPVSFPQWAGPFRVRGSRLNPTTGNVALLTETDPSHPAGFVRDMGQRTELYHCYETIIRGDSLHVFVWPGWCFHSED